MMRTEQQRTLEETADRQPAARRVLLVDENVQDLNSEALVLEQQGFVVYRCSSYQTALRLVEREDFDLAVVDQGSAEFDALPMLRHLVRYGPSTPFIVVAAHKDMACYLEALDVGALDYFEKPLPAAELRRILLDNLGSPSTRLEH